MRLAIEEKCACGATTTADGSAVDVGVYVASWREGHGCVKPGLCWNDSGVPVLSSPDPDITVRCELQAGHAGAHEATRPNGGSSVWESTEEAQA